MSMLNDARLSSLADKISETAKEVKAVEKNSKGSGRSSPKKLKGKKYGKKK